MFSENSDPVDEQEGPVHYTLLVMSEVGDEVKILEKQTPQVGAWD